MKIKHLFLALATAFICHGAFASPVKMTMNNVSKTMTLATRAGEAVATGDPANMVYTFDAPAGEYVLTAYATDGETVNGTIVLDVEDSATEQEFKVITCTAYAVSYTHLTLPTT